MAVGLILDGPQAEAILHAGKSDKAAEEQLARYQERLEHLVEERTKQEQYQRKIAESLQEIAAALNSSLDQEVVLKKILEQLERVILYDGAALYLLDGEDLKVMDARGSI